MSALDYFLPLKNTRKNSITLSLTNYILPKRKVKIHRALYWWTIGIPRLPPAYLVKFRTIGWALLLFSLMSVTTNSGTSKCGLKAVVSWRQPQSICLIRVYGNRMWYKWLLFCQTRAVLVLQGHLFILKAAMNYYISAAAGKCVAGHGFHQQSQLFVRGAMSFWNRLSLMR